MSINCEERSPPAGKNGDTVPARCSSRRWNLTVDVARRLCLASGGETRERDWHEGRVRVASDLVIRRFDKGTYSQGRQWQVIVPHFLSDAAVAFIDVTCGVKMASLTHP